MFAQQSAKVLIVAEDPAQGRRWTEILQQAGAEILPSKGEDQAASYDVLVTDLPPRGPSLAAVLGIGPAAAPGADAKLPADCTPRELQLACTLLAEIARLRVERDARARGERQATALAETDALTALANRRAWDRELPAKLALAHRAGEPLWLAIVDLDRFKAINDRCGFSAGDRVLWGAAGALAATLRRDDLIARIGGDEFGVLLLGIAETHVRTVLERLRLSLAAIALPAGITQLTVSIGYAASTQHRDPDALFAAAERALREAKRAGGNAIRP